MSEGATDGPSLVELADGIADEIENSSPEDREYFKRHFISSLNGAFLSTIVPDKDGIIYASRAAVRLRTRKAAAEFRAQNPDLSALELLKAYNKILAQKYDEAAELDPELIHERDGAHLVVDIVTKNDSIVDEDLAREILEYAGL